MRAAPLVALLACGGGQPHFAFDALSDWPGSWPIVWTCDGRSCTGKITGGLLLGSKMRGTVLPLCPEWSVIVGMGEVWEGCARVDRTDLHRLHVDAGSDGSALKEPFDLLYDAPGHFVSSSTRLSFGLPGENPTELTGSFETTGPRQP